jgi:hypothetical protein
MPATLAKLSVDDQRVIRAGEMTYENITHYVRRIVVGSGEVLNAATVQRIGVCSINAAKIPQNQNMLIAGIRVAYAFTAAGGETAPAAVKYQNSDTISQELPAALANGELEMSIAGVRVLTVPVSSFFAREATSSSEGTQGSTDAFVLESLELLTSDKEIKFEIKIADGVGLPAGNHFIEVKWYGIGTRRRG